MDKRLVAVWKTESELLKQLLLKSKLSTQGTGKKTSTNYFKIQGF